MAILCFQMYTEVEKKLEMLIRCFFFSYRNTRNEGKTNFGELGNFLPTHFQMGVGAGNQS